MDKHDDVVWENRTIDRIKDSEEGVYRKTLMGGPFYPGKWKKDFRSG